MNRQRPVDISRRSQFPSERVSDRKGTRFRRCGNVRTIALVIGGIIALVLILGLALFGISKIQTTHTFSDGAVDVDLPATMRAAPKKPAGAVLVCEDRFRGLVIAAYALPDNDPQNLVQFARKATRGGTVSHSGSQITATGFPSRVSVNGADAFQVRVTGKSNGKQFKGHMTFLHLANKNYAVMTAAPSSSFKRHADELNYILKTVRVSGTSVRSDASGSAPDEFDSIASSNANSVTKTPAEPHIRAKFESVATAINVLKNNRLPSNANADANQCETNKGWRSSAVAYLQRQPMSPSQQAEVIECIDEIVKSDDTLLDRNEFYEMLARSKWELPDSAMLEFSTQMLQGDNQFSLHSLKARLVTWIKQEQPESLAELVIDAAIRGNREAKQLLTIYQQQASRRVFQEKLRGSVSSYQIADLQKLVGEPDFAEVQRILLEALSDADDDNDDLVLEYLLSKTPAEASPELRLKASQSIASNTGNFSGSEGHLSKLVDDWLMEAHYELFAETLQASSSHDRRTLLPVAMSLDSDTVLQGVIDSIDSHVWVSEYSDHLPDSQEQRDRFEILLIKSCDIYDPDRVAKCCELLATFGGARSVVAINNARNWAYDNDSFHLRVAADRALKKLSGRININDALRDRKQHLAELRPIRTWTSGKYKLEAKLVKIDGDYVVLEKKDGSTTRVETSRLDKEDKRYVERARKE